MSSFIQGPWNYNSPQFFSIFARINDNKGRNRNPSLDPINLWNILSFKEHNQRRIKKFKENDPNSPGKAKIWVENIRRGINR